MEEKILNWHFRLGSHGVDVCFRLKQPKYDLRVQLKEDVLELVREPEQQLLVGVHCFEDPKWILSDPVRAKKGILRQHGS